MWATSPLKWSKFCRQKFIKSIRLIWKTNKQTKTNRWGSLDQPISAMVFVFGYFNVCHKDWVIYFGGTRIDLVNSVIIFYLKRPYQMFSFLLSSKTVILTVLLFWIYLFLLTLVFVLQWLPPLENFDPAKKNNTLVSRNAGDKKNLHPGGHKIFFFLST